MKLSQKFTCMSNNYINSLTLTIVTKYKQISISASRIYRKITCFQLRTTDIDAYLMTCKTYLNGTIM